MTTATATTTTFLGDIAVTPVGDGKAVANVAGVGYIVTDCGQTVRLQKYLINGGQEYVVRVGTRGTYGCNCPDSVYRRRQCKHCRIANAVLDVIF